MVSAASVLTSFSTLPRLIRSPWDRSIRSALTHGQERSQRDSRNCEFAGTKLPDSNKDSREKKPRVLQCVVDYNDREGHHRTAGILEREALDQVFARSDTTSATMRALILHFATNSRVLNKLLGEISRADEADLFSEPVAKFDE